MGVSHPSSAVHPGPSSNLDIYITRASLSRALQSIHQTIDPAAGGEEGKKKEKNFLAEGYTHRTGRLLLDRQILDTQIQSPVERTQVSSKSLFPLLVFFFFFFSLLRLGAGC
jgi:hypothetical protein